MISNYQKQIDGWVGVVLQTANFGTVGAGLTDDTTIVNPVGTNTLVLVTFNPDFARRIQMELVIQSSKRIVLQGFQTDIGLVGKLHLDEPMSSRDKLIFEIRNKTAVTLDDISVSFGFIYENRADAVAPV